MTENSKLQRNYISTSFTVVPHYIGYLSNTIYLRQQPDFPVLLPNLDINVSTIEPKVVISTSPT